MWRERWPLRKRARVTIRPGSVLQLMPNEVMVKHEKGFNPATRDWEFFYIDVDEERLEDLPPRLYQRQQPPGA